AQRVFTWINSTAIRAPSVGVALPRLGDRPVDQLPAQRIAGAAERLDHAFHARVGAGLAHFEASAAEGALVVPAHQPGLQLDHHLRSAVDVLALEGTQIAEKAEVGIQIGVLVDHRRSEERRVAYAWSTR